MQKSAVVTGEVRQLIAEKRLDVLLLQEPYAGKLGSSGTICRLGLGVRVVLLEELIQAFGLYVVNDAAQPPSYWTTKGSSYIDVTLASPEMFRFVGNWRVRTDWMSSDHNAVVIRLSSPKAAAGERRAGNTRFDTRRADWEQYATTLAEHSRQQLEPLELGSAGDFVHMAATLSGVISDACSESMPRKRTFWRSNPWRTRELTKRKKAVYRLRRGF